MLRKIIKINEKLCNGCGLCAEACHEGAIGMVNGKAILLKENYCDGLGDCLPVCPTGAISFEEREAEAYDEAAVLASKKRENIHQHTGGCPGSMAQALNRKENTPCQTNCNTQNESQLMQWPVQIKLVPINAPYFDNADLLVAADCAAYAYADFHRDFISGKVTLIGCPKLDEGDYSDKLTEIIKNNNINSITVARIVVPCCGGIEQAVKKAVQQSGKIIPVNVVTITIDGKLL